MNSWLFPPQTREVQFDEKWSFVGKKQKHCDVDKEADDLCGDNWDHVALDPEHRLVVCVVPGKRSPEHTDLLVEEFRQRTGGRVMNLMTSDEYPAYPEAILNAYGETVTPPPGKRGRPAKPKKALPAGLTYATVHKTRENNRVVKTEARLVFGTLAALTAALALSTVSERVNTVYVERHNGTDRNRNGRKARKTYCFSKDWEVHEAMTYFTMYSYNFCWPVRTLRVKNGDGKWEQRTPAMTAGLTDHVWSLEEWIAFPAVKPLPGRPKPWENRQC
jgi:IS1 family transposase